MSRTRRFERRAVAFLLSALVLACLACSDRKPPLPPGSFTRPTSVDFVCVDNGQVAPLTRCETDSDKRALYAVVTQSSRGEVASVNLERSRILDNRRDIPGYTFVPTGVLPVRVVVPPVHSELTYVVSFGSRELVVMRTSVLVSLTDDEPIVQQIQLGIATDAGTAGGTPTDIVLTPDERTLLVTVPDTGEVVRLPIVRCAEDDTACEDGLIDEDAVERIDLSAAVAEIDPDTTVQTVVPEDRYELMCGGYRHPEVTAPAAPSPPLSFEGAPRPSALALDTVCDGRDGRDCQARVLVADEALPLLHVIDLDAVAEGSAQSALRAPIVTGAPTRDVVVTPAVPTQVGQEDATHYVYAVDATDGSVLVLEDDRVLLVNADPSQRADRLTIGSQNGAKPGSAIALEVLTPAFNPAARANQQTLPSTTDEQDISPLYCTDALHPFATPSRLRGVYLAAVLADNSVRVFDVHDMTLTSCRDCPSETEQAPALLRHHLRMRTDFLRVQENERQELSPTVGSAAFFTGGFGYALRPDGTATTGDTAGLDCIVCDPDRLQGFPDPQEQQAFFAQQELGEENVEEATDAGIAQLRLCPETRTAVICGERNPWLGTPERWQLEYEGLIPGTQGHGRFVPPEGPGSADNRTGALEVITSARVCDSGALGEVDMPLLRDESACEPLPPEDPDAGILDEVELPKPLPPSGDQLIVRSPVLDDSRLRALYESQLSGRELDSLLDRCTSMREARDEPNAPLIAFEIRATYQDRVVIRRAPIAAIGMVSDYVQVLECLGPGPLELDIRALDSFIVQGSQSAFQHRVTARESDGRCVIDTKEDPLKVGRAWRGCGFKNRKLQLRPSLGGGERPDAEPPRGLVLQLDLATTGVAMSFDARRQSIGLNALVPTMLKYNSINRFLYLVDSYRGGLIPINTDPYPEAAGGSFY